MDEHGENVASSINETEEALPQHAPPNRTSSRSKSATGVMEKKTKQKPAPSGLVRLNVNLTQESAETLRKATQAKGISYTDAVRRALAVTDMIDKQLSMGRSIQAEGPDGVVRELIFL